MAFVFTLPHESSIIGLDVRAAFALSKVLALFNQVAAASLKENALAEADLIGFCGWPYLDSCPMMLADEPELAAAYARGTQVALEEGEAEDQWERFVEDAIAVEETYATIVQDMNDDVFFECQELGLIGDSPCAAAAPQCLQVAPSQD